MAAEELTGTSLPFPDGVANDDGGDRRSRRVIFDQAADLNGLKRHSKAAMSAYAFVSHGPVLMTAHEASLPDQHTSAISHQRPGL